LNGDDMNALFGLFVATDIIDISESIQVLSRILIGWWKPLLPSPEIVSERVFTFGPSLRIGRYLIGHPPCRSTEGFSE